jgi:hypothetical protein
MIRGGVRGSDRRFVINRILLGVNKNVARKDAIRDVEVYMRF